jgi:hypothetical protein
MSSTDTVVMNSESAAYNTVATDRQLLTLVLLVMPKMYDQTD